MATPKYVLENAFFVKYVFFFFIFPLRLNAHGNFKIALYLYLSFLSLKLIIAHPKMSLVNVLQIWVVK